MGLWKPGIEAIVVVVVDVLVVDFDFDPFAVVVVDGATYGATTEKLLPVMTVTGAVCVGSNSSVVCPLRLCQIAWALATTAGESEL